ncbi:hypothetical protein [Gloeobacter morelensis]|uniref:hypothetical protein n=1 Tax=Gloeobacter morelensis TaxID=2907343 RepID=UPI001E5EFECD|nr:hypothetical protein [Gloeobacter morelensis]UFP97131.1 hypothetical protein ISF26_23710 [Gloeobacter morelensis MG652769]
MSTFAAVGCGGRSGLSREKALELLKESALFRPNSIASRQVGQIYERFLTGSSLSDPLYSSLKRLGFIFLAPAQKPGYLAGLPVNGFELRLTPAGKKHAEAENWPRYGDQWDVVLARKRLSGITGVSEASDGRARASYSYKWVPTPVGLQVKQMLADTRFAGTQKYALYFSYTLEWKDELTAEATFSRFDDGWRLG